MSTRPIGVAVIGAGMAGRAHLNGYRQAATQYGAGLPEVRLVAVADAHEPFAEDAARRYGYRRAETDWRAIVEADDIDAVSIVVANSLHREIVEALLAAGKHVLCEKPLANSVAEAVAMTEAAGRANLRGVRAMVGFSYRRVPALGLARDLVAQGRLGRIHHVRAVYLQDWIVDPAAPLSWRLDKEKAGSGALGDIGAHVVDAAQFILGDTIGEVSGMLETFVSERPLASAHSGLSGTAAAGQTGQVTVDDAALFLARFTGGALGSFEATRFANGRKNALRIEVNGSAGSLAFDLEDMNVLQFFDGTGDSAVAGFRRIMVTEPEHPYVAAWWPAGHGLGYEHAFTHQAVDFVRAVAAGTDPAPSFADGLQVQRVLAAVEASATSRTWQQV